MNSKRKRQREWGEEISDEIMTEIFRNNESDQSLTVKITGKITKKKFTFGCIIVKLPKTKDKEAILKAASKKR